MSTINKQSKQDIAALRHMPLLGARSGNLIDFQGHQLLNLSSNDYMGYAGDETIIKEFYSELDDTNLIGNFGPGSSASRLLSGNHPGYTKLENTLEESYGKPALVFTSGYHANIGILSALAGKNDLILADRLSHASMIDGIRLSNAKHQRYPHLDFTALRNILEEKRAQHEKIFVVTESIFSMDGDTADLQALTVLKKEFDFTLYVDEAHAVGATGPNGLGIAEAVDVIKDIDIIVGTFGKALGGLGSFAICSNKIKQQLVNKSRSLIFTTALPPVITHWNNWILNKMRDDTTRRSALAELANRFRAELTKINIETRGNSHIVPAIIGSNEAAVKLSSLLNKNGYMALPIRPPTVPPNTARLRFSLSASMTWDDLSGIFPLMAGNRINPPRPAATPPKEGTKIAPSPPAEGCQSTSTSPPAEGCQSTSTSPPAEGCQSTNTSPPPEGCQSTNTSPPPEGWICRASSEAKTGWVNPLETTQNEI